MHVEAEQVADAVGEEDRVSALLYEPVHVACEQPLVDQSLSNDPR